MKFVKRILVGCVCVLLLSSCSVDFRNRAARKGIEYFDGNFKVTYYSFAGPREWKVKNGKVTTSPSGYYFFWCDSGTYVQVPMEGTVIEEIK